MEGIIINKEFTSLAVVDIFDSFLWIERLNLCGDFEIYASATSSLLSAIKRKYYLRIKESEHLMIIEDIKVDTDFEDGNKILITGRSLESILDRRIIWVQTVLHGNFQDEIERLLDEAVMNPIIEPELRKIPNFIFKHTDDPLITSLEIKAQFTGANLYEAISSLCQSYGIGFKITLNKSNQFVFELYSGKERSFDQHEIPYVIFSEEFDNVVDSSYFESDRLEKTATLVAGEGEGIERRTHAVYAKVDAAGLERREMYTDARDIQSEVYEEGASESTILPEGEYMKLLERRGLEKLAENSYIQTFEAKVKEGQGFKFDVDYFMGDIIQVINNYGMQLRSRVIELIRSNDKTGLNIYPTFGPIVNKEEE